MQAGGASQPASSILSEADRSFAVHMMEHLVVPAFVLDMHGRVMIWNRACERLTGVPAARLIGTSDHWTAFYGAERPCLADLVATRRFDAIDGYYGGMSRFHHGEFGASVEGWCDLPHAGQGAYLAIDAGPVYDAAGAFVAVVETLRDITAQKRAQHELEALAACDGLTGVANRRSFDLALATEFKRCHRAGLPLSLLMIDVDQFKGFNDSHGHQGGDECLKHVARTLAGLVRRAGDLVARYGGEEFAVILPNTELDGAAVIAERIRHAVEDLRIAHPSSAVAPHVTVSIGAATGSLSIPHPRFLVTVADEALYRAKHGGRNRCCLAAVPDDVAGSTARDGA